MEFTELTSQKNRLRRIDQREEDGRSKIPTNYRSRSVRDIPLASYVGTAHANNLRHASEARAPYARR